MINPFDTSIRGAPAVSDSSRNAWRWVLILATLAVVLLVLELALVSVGWINTHLLRPSALPPFVARCVDLYLHIVLIAGALVGVEFLFPGNHAPKRYSRAALFWACYVPVSVVSADIAHLVVQHYGIKPLFSLRFESLKVAGLAGVAMNAAAVLLSAFLFDFFYYWFHRLQHVVPFMWAFHSVHHSNRSLNVLSCYHHPMEDLWRLPLLLLPIALIFEVVAPSLFLVSAFVAAWGIFNHMDSSFSLGRLRYVLADNHYHRLHHSIASDHFNVNYAGMFSMWDRLFRTQIMPPKRAEMLEVGVADVPDPQSVRQYLSAPFVILQKMLPGKREGVSRQD